MKKGIAINKSSSEVLTNNSELLSNIHHVVITSGFYAKL